MINAQVEGLLHNEVGQNRNENFIRPIQPYKKETRQNEVARDPRRIFIQN